MAEVRGNGTGGLDGVGRTRKGRSTGGGRQQPKQRLAPVLEQMGLGTYESRVLAVLIQLGSATASQLSKLSGVSRPNVYPALESLTAKGLADPRHGKVTEWSSPARDEIVSRIIEAQERRLHDVHTSLQTKAEEARLILAKMKPAAPAPGPVLRVVANDVEIVALYNRFLGLARREILVTNRGPYAGRIVVSPEVIDALGRGVKARALYQQEEIDDPGFAVFNETIRAYQEAGVEGRVVDSLPVSMAVFDQEVALVVMDDPAAAESGFPTQVHVEHAGFAALCVNAFELQWATARPYDPARSDERVSIA